jgi:hypothetical protein
MAKGKEGDDAFSGQHHGHSTFDINIVLAGAGLVNLLFPPNRP